MGIVSAIVALLKAFPSMERLISDSLDGYREWAAEERRRQKHRDIDDAVDFFAKLPDGETQRGAGDDKSSGVSGGGKSRTGLDTGSAEETGRHGSTD
tara:strand:- start:147 stop:437 length:291 start_codon:yes stop_codon:yes gene_type:complete